MPRTVPEPLRSGPARGHHSLNNCKGTPLLAGLVPRRNRRDWVPNPIVCAALPIVPTADAARRLPATAFGVVGVEGKKQLAFAFLDKIKTEFDREMGPSAQQAGPGALEGSFRCAVPPVPPQTPLKVSCLATSTQSHACSPVIPAVCQGGPFGGKQEWGWGRACNKESAGS